MDDKRSAKRKPDFSNVQSGSSSTARRPAGGSSTPHRTYVVKPGDTLSEIAEREYGDAGQWRRIYDANRDTIEDPDLIHPGDTLKLPSA
jgi:nucleoid-associated protein YgaU